MKKYTIVIAIFVAISSIQCKKEKSPEYAEVKTIVLNQSIGDPGTSGWNHSYGLDLDGVNTSTDQSDHAYYLGSYNDQANPTGNKYIKFVANDYHLLMYNNQDFKLKKFEVGDVVNGSEEDGSRGNFGNDGDVLNNDANEVTNFSLNSTIYLGLYYEGGYNGWVKIKTLNNYHNFILVSYSVSKTEGLPVLITE